MKLESQFIGIEFVDFVTVGIEFVTICQKVETIFNVTLCRISITFFFFYLLEIFLKRVVLASMY